MKNTFKAASLWLLPVLCFMAVACENFLEVDVPDGQLTGELVFNDAATAQAAVNNIYSRLSQNALLTGNSSGISILLGSYTDELETFNQGIPEFTFYQNTLLPGDAQIRTFWNSAYNLIYASNAVIEGVQASTALSQADKERLTGEALFIRGMIHFYLSQLFGNVPYVTTTDYGLNTNISKTSVEEVLSLAGEDLEVAMNLLPDFNEGTMRTRPGKDGIKALLARIKLFSGDWEEAILYSGQLIDSGSYPFMALQETFSKTSTSTIWQLPTLQEGMPTLEGQNFIFTSGPPPNRALASSLVNAFEPGDIRKEQWIGTITDGNQNWYYPAKYTQYVPESTSREYSIMLRIEEMYLIRAEAKARLGDISGASQDLDSIRLRAGLAQVNYTSEEQLVLAILQERRVEFFTELGHRFFDLKRAGVIDEVLTLVKPSWQDTDKLWPLPEGELLLNQNLLPQNSGY